MNEKTNIAVHKFSSCDGCQLTLLNMGPSLLELLANVNIVHFAEMGIVNDGVEVDISFIEGSISTKHEIERLKKIRKHSKMLVSIGACANAGGIQSLRNDFDGKEWLASIYPNIDCIDFKKHSLPLSDVIYIDYQVWGCPINEYVFTSLLKDLLLKVRPRKLDEKLCMECKRQQKVCTLVSDGQCCMGPITRSGCGVLCPSVASACYGCFGPAENINSEAMLQKFIALGVSKQQATKRIRFIHSQNSAFDAIKP